MSRVADIAGHHGENGNIGRWRGAIYLSLATVLGGISYAAYHTEWSGFDDVHTLLEGSAAIVALIVSAMAFTRYYSRPEAKYLWLATGFLGAGFFDAYHTALTTWMSAVYFPALLSSAAEWSEFAPRFFLAVILCVSAWTSSFESTMGSRWGINETAVYCVSVSLFVASAGVFSLLDLPSLHQQGAIFAQPLELIPAALFGLALLGYLRKGLWRERIRKFDHWIVLALILGIFENAGLMAFSTHQLDAGYDWAHFAKFAGYLCVMVGLLISMRYAFRQATDSDRRFREAVHTMGEGFALYDAEDRLVVFNDAYLDLHPATREFIHVGMRFEDFVRATVKSRSIEASIGNEEAYIRNRLAQHRNPTGPIVRELVDGTSYIINETPTAEGGIAVVETEITEQKRIEAELAEKSTFLEAVFDAMDDGISVWSPENRLLALNEKFETLMGREEDQLNPGMHIRDVFIMNAHAGHYGEGDPDELGNRRYENAIQAPADVTQIVTFDRHGTYEVIRHPMADGSRITLHRNITDRIAAEQRLGHVVENLSELFVLWDGQDRLALHNKKFIETNSAIADICEIGLPFEKFIRTGVERGMFPGAASDPEAWIQRRIKQHRNPTGMTEIEREDGLWLLMHEQRLPDGGTVSISSDISAIKQAEARVRDREERLAAIVENVVDGILTFDQNGHVLSANASAAGIFGCASEALKGRLIRDFISEEGQEVDAPDRVEALLRDGADGIMELNGLRFGGEAFPMEIAVTKVEADDGNFFVCIVRDISIRREMDRMKSEFVSTVSHELRTPLTSIRASLGLIVAGAVGELSEQASELVAIAERNAHRLIGLVNDILDMEKIESGRMDFKLIQQPVADLVRQALVDNQGYADEHNVEFEFTDAAEGAAAVLDSERMTQVMANLLSNAAKFSPAGSKIQIRLSIVDAKVRISVIDAGEGVPEEFRAKIFEKFTQADSTDTRKVGGTGLGLSISRSIVERHGGTIDYKNEPNAGAHFYVDLPLSRTHRIDESPSRRARLQA